jgi:ABC-type sugar transport system ATPase subunit
MNPVLQVEKLYKRFGTLEVIRGISFEVFPNEVVGLAGLSGSGKSVIAKVLAGLYAPNSGSLTFNGARLPPKFEASRLGLEVIHQYPVLTEGLSVTENIFLGHELYQPYVGRLRRSIRTTAPARKPKCCTAKPCCSKKTSKCRARSTSSCWRSLPSRSRRSIRQTRRCKTRTAAC